MAAGYTPRHAERAGLSEPPDRSKDDLLCAAGSFGGLWRDVRADADLLDQSAADGGPGAVSSEHNDGAAGCSWQGLRVVCAGAADRGAVCGFFSGAARGDYLD